MRGGSFCWDNQRGLPGGSSICSVRSVSEEGKIPNRGTISKSRFLAYPGGAGARRVMQ